MKIKLNTADAIRLVRLLTYSDVDMLFEEGGDDASKDLAALDKVYDQLVLGLRDRGVSVTDYAGDKIVPLSERDGAEED